MLLTADTSLSELREQVAEHRRELRQCDTQKTAVAWMAKAHELLGECMDRLADAAKEPPLLLAPERQRLVVVQSLAEAKNYRRPEPLGFFDPRVKTVVYPSQDPPPGSRLAPKAWTRKDTDRLVRANVNMRRLEQFANRKKA